MDFAQGRFTGHSQFRLFDFRFDPETGLVSGEVFRLATVDGDKLPEVLAEFVAGLNAHLVDPNGERLADLSLSADQSQLILERGGMEKIVFTRSGANPGTLQLDYDRFGFPDQATLRRDTSGCFRSLKIEIDRMSNVDALADFTVNGVAHSMKRSFAKTGIDVSLDVSNQFQLPAGLTGDSWSVAELSNVMESQFNSFNPAKEPISWRTYLFIASKYRGDNEHKVRGIMFDVQKRRGAAIFFDALKDDLGDHSTRAGRMLRAAMHEIGHALNLLHSDDPASDALSSSALSFMNRPENFPTPNKYWDQFTFAFDDGEKRILRHGPLQQLVMGGDIFRGEPAQDSAFSKQTPALERLRGARLELRVRPRRAGQPRRGGEGIPIFDFGEPVHIEAKLSCRGQNSIHLNEPLSVASRSLCISIAREGRAARVFRPVYQFCHESKPTILNARRPAIHADLYLGYGADGFTFLEPGMYNLTATFATIRGVVQSPPLPIWVRYPTREQENLIVPTFTAEIGRFLALGGLSVFQEVRADLEALEDDSRMNQHPLTMELRARHLVQSALGQKRLIRKSKAKKESVIFEAPTPQVSELRKLVGLEPELQQTTLSNIQFGETVGVLWNVLDDQNASREKRMLKQHALTYLRKQRIKKPAERQFQQAVFKSNLREGK